MPADLTINAVTADTTTVTPVGDAIDGTNEYQLSPRKEFDFCVSPIFSLARGQQVIGKLNQAQRYFIRARSKRANNSIEAWSQVRAFRTLDGAQRNLVQGGIIAEPAMLVVPVPVLSWEGSNTVAGYDADNLAIDAPVAWRAFPDPFYNITVETAGDEIDVFALLNTNLPEGAVVTLIAGNSRGEVFSNARYISPDFPFRASANLPGRMGYHGLFRLPPGLRYKWWRIQIGGERPPGDLIHIEHAVFGQNRSSKNHSVDKSETPVDLGVLERGRSGNPQRSRGFRMRRVEFDISHMTEAKFEVQYSQLGELVGSTDPVLCVPNSKSGAFLHDRILYGTLTGGRIVNSRSPIFTRSFTIDSII